MIKNKIRQIIILILAMVLISGNTVFADNPMKYTVTFNTDGGTAISSQNVVSGGKANKPTDPTKTNNIFKGWYKESAFTNIFDFNTGITGDTTIYAKWEPVKYTVSFNSNGGSSVPTASVDYGAKVARPSDPTRSGYDFKGWYKEAGLTNSFDFNAPITGNTTAYAKWDKKDTGIKPDPDKDKNKRKYKVYFDTDGGTRIERVEVVENEKVKKPKDPYKAGYIFDGWYDSSRFKDRNKYDFNTPVDSNMTLYAKWKDDKGTNEVDFVVYGPNRRIITEERDYVVGRYDTIMQVTEMGLNKKNKYMDKEKDKDDKERDKREKVTFKKKGKTIISIDGIDNTKEYQWRVYVNDRLIEENDMEKFELRYEDRIKWSYDYIYNEFAFTESLVSTKAKGKYISGYKDNTFRPENFITREEVASVIHKLIDKKHFKELDSKVVWFYDVEPGRWSEADIADLAKLGVYGGYSDKTFRPRAYISRGEVAVILSRINGLPLSGNDMFVDTTMHWARREINAVADQGWIRGYKEDRTFRPNDPITRAEFVSMINSSLGLRRTGKEKKNPFRDLKSGKWYYHEVLLAV